MIPLMTPDRRRLDPVARPWAARAARPIRPLAGWEWRQATYTAPSEMAAEATPTPPTIIGRDGWAAISGSRRKAAPGDTDRARPAAAGAAGGGGAATAPIVALIPLNELLRNGATVPGLARATASASGRPDCWRAAPAARRVARASSKRNEGCTRVRLARSSRAANRTAGSTSTSTGKSATRRSSAAISPSR